ncbi:MAG: nucleotidyltransferase domain-containing protein [Magnetococcales bacterium]|nr:nucleotidyltransferase domain-containing protein [Magnetococcales bacterium]
MGGLWYGFGSRVTGGADDESDLDLAILTPPASIR